AALAKDDFVQPIERDAKVLGRFELAERLQVLLQQDFARWNRRPKPIRIPTDSLRRGLRAQVRSPTETPPGTAHPRERCGGPPSTLGRQRQRRSASKKSSRRRAHRGRTDAWSVHSKS